MHVGVSTRPSRVRHIISHRCSRNKVQHHNFLTYESFSLRNFWLTRTSTCAEIMWQTRCDMFTVMHRHDFVSQKVYRQPSFSVWTRAWTHLVVDTLRGNMSVEHNIGNCVKSCTQTRASMRKFSCEHIHVSQKSCVEGRLFTVNTHHSPSRGSNHCSQSWLCMWKIAYWEEFVS